MIERKFSFIIDKEKKEISVTISSKYGALVYEDFDSFIISSIKNTLKIEDDYDGCLMYETVVHSISDKATYILMDMNTDEIIDECSDKDFEEAKKFFKKRIEDGKVAIPNDCDPAVYDLAGNKFHPVSVQKNITVDI
jgi:hypothetical protein